MASTSASVADPIADAGEQRSRKRRKKSSSTLAAARSSQLTTQLQSRRRTRSRVGSPATNVERTSPPRVSARFARKVHPFINSRSTDIYTHLADPDSAGNLLSEPSAGSVMSSIPDETTRSQLVKRTRGCRRKIVDLTDKNAKDELMEEWARLRRSRGTFPLMGIDENACFSQMLLRSTRKGDESVSSTQLEAITERKSPDPDSVQDETTIISILQPQATILDVSSRSSSSTRMDFENTLAAGTIVSTEKLDHDVPMLSPNAGGTGQSIFPGVDIGVLSTSLPDSRTDEDLGDGLAGIPETICQPQCPRSSPQIIRNLPSREYTVHTRRTKLTEFPVNEQAEAVATGNPSKDDHSVTLQTSSLDSTSIHFDSDEEFHMLEIPEIFTLPWVPVASHLYVPPSLGKLVSGMREQLVMEARARRRVEELYQAELSRRVSAEKIIEDLRTALKERRDNLAAC